MSSFVSDLNRSCPHSWAELALGGAVVLSHNILLGALGLYVLSVLITNVYDI